MKQIKSNIYLLTCFLVILFSSEMQGQELPPIPVDVQVSTEQFLNFGAFTVGDAGGSVVVDYTGTRTWTGDVTLLNMGAPITPALFDVYVNPGTLITITHPAQFELMGDSGNKIYLEINSYSSGQNFVSTNAAEIPNSVYIGGTLLLGNPSANPPGKYSGTITITFNQQ